MLYCTEIEQLSHLFHIFLQRGKNSITWHIKTCDIQLSVSLRLCATFSYAFFSPCRHMFDTRSCYPSWKCERVFSCANMLLLSVVTEKKRCLSEAELAFSKSRLTQQRSSSAPRTAKPSLQMNFRRNTWTKAELRRQDSLFIKRPFLLTWLAHIKTNLLCCPTLFVLKLPLEQDERQTQTDH